jgi:hypothetical protein
MRPDLTMVTMDRSPNADAYTIDEVFAAACRRVLLRLRRDPRRADPLGWRRVFASSGPTPAPSSVAGCCNAPRFDDGDHGSFEAYTEKHDDYRLLCRARRVVGAVLEVDFAKIDAFDAG